MNERDKMQKKTVVIVEDEKPIAEAERLILESEYTTVFFCILSLSFMTL